MVTDVVQFNVEEDVRDADLALSIAEARRHSTKDPSRRGEIEDLIGGACWAVEVACLKSISTLVALSRQ